MTVQEQAKGKPEIEDPQFTVGEFTIKKWSDKAVFIRKTDGEGRQFPADRFEKAIRDFYNQSI